MTSRHFASDRQMLGRLGEEVAARYLERLGLVVVGRNVRMSGGEIDLVARHGDELVFVEVKTRIGDGSTAPDEVIGEAKLRRLERLAHAYVEQHTDPEHPWRIDVVVIVLSRSGQLVRCDYQPGAFL